MKKLLLATIVLSAIVLQADEEAPKKSGREIMNEIAMRRYGGKIRQPNTERGSIVFVNTQKLVDRAVLEKVVARLERQFKFTTVISETDVRSSSAQFVVRLEDIDREERMLVAPENFWASVNVKALAADNPPKAVLEDRFTKEALRAFAFVCGGAGGVDGGGLCRIVTRVSDLDVIPGLDYSLDVETCIINNMKNSKVRPYRIAKYSEACKEGWAPKPENEYQQAIWDAYHTVPTEGLKIEFDPKKGK